MLLDFIVDVDARVASLKSAEDDPRKTVFNLALLSASPYTKPKLKLRPLRYIL